MVVRYPINGFYFHPPTRTILSLFIFHSPSTTFDSVNSLKQIQKYTLSDYSLMMPLKFDLSDYPSLSDIIYALPALNHCLIKDSALPHIPLRQMSFVYD